MNETVVPCEVYSRVVGYFRPVHNWNKGKKQEFQERVEFSEEVSLKNPKATADVCNSEEAVAKEVLLTSGESLTETTIDTYKLFSFPNCSKCEEVKEFLKDQPFSGAIIDLKSPEGNKEFRGYYSSLKDNIKRDEKGTIKLPVVFFMKGDEVISTTQGVEETKSMLA